MNELLGIISTAIAVILGLGTIASQTRSIWRKPKIGIRFGLKKELLKDRLYKNINFYKRCSVAILCSDKGLEKDTCIPLLVAVENIGRSTVKNLKIKIRMRVDHIIGTEEDYKNLFEGKRRFRKNTRGTHVLVSQPSFPATHFKNRSISDMGDRGEIVFEIAEFLPEEIFSGPEMMLFRKSGHFRSGQMFKNEEKIEKDLTKFDNFVQSVGIEMEVIAENHKPISRNFLIIWVIQRKEEFNPDDTRYHKMLSSVFSLTNLRPGLRILYPWDPNMANSALPLIFVKMTPLSSENGEEIMTIESDPPTIAMTLCREPEWDFLNERRPRYLD